MLASTLYRARWYWAYIPLLLMAAFAMWWSITQWQPLPPRTIAIATGIPGTGAADWAPRYRSALDRLGLEVRLVSTPGFSGSAAAVGGDQPLADVGFGMGEDSDAQRRSGQAAPSVSGGEAAAASTPGKAATPADVVTLGAIERQPLWLFTRLGADASLGALRGARLGLPAGDATSAAEVATLLSHAQMKSTDAGVRSVPAELAALELIEGRIDTLAVVASPRSDIVRQLSRDAYLSLMPVPNVAALAARERRLRPFAIPQGAIEVRGDVPPKDLSMVGLNLHLLVNEEAHPALQRLLMDVAQNMHERPSFLQRQGEFPNLRDVDFEVSPVARASAFGARPLAEQVLPYWWAQLAEWIALSALPILIITSWLLSMLPRLLTRRFESVLQVFYGKLAFLQHDVTSELNSRPGEIKRMLASLDELDLAVLELDLPERFAPLWYALRQNIEQTRQAVLAMRSR